jgi:hypothetical protein
VFAPTSPLPGASTCPPLFRNNAAHNGRAGVPGAALSDARGRWSGRAPGLGRAPDAGERTHSGRQRGKDGAGGRAQLQPNRSDGGGRGAGTWVGRPRWVRILRITTGSSMLPTGGRATTRPHAAAGCARPRRYLAAARLGPDPLGGPGVHCLRGLPRGPGGAKRARRTASQASPSLCTSQTTKARRVG